MIIESHEEHCLMLNMLDDLMESGHSKVDGKLIELVSSTIEAYEKIHFPMPEPTAEEAAAFRRAAGGTICERDGHRPNDELPPLTICDRCGKVLDP